MSKKSKPQAIESKHERDMASFEGLQEKTKKLMKLKDQNEKTTGSEQAVVTSRIRETTREDQLQCYAADF